MIFTTTFQISFITQIGFSLCRMYCSICKVRPELYAILLNRDKEPIVPISSHSSNNHNSNNHNSNSSNHNHSNNNQILYIYLSNHPLVQ